MCGLDCVSRLCKLGIVVSERKFVNFSSSVLLETNTKFKDEDKEKARNSLSSSSQDLNDGKARAFKLLTTLNVFFVEPCSDSGSIIIMLDTWMMLRKWRK